MTVRRIILLFALLLSVTLSFGQAPCYDNLTQDNHPRLFIKDADIKTMRRQIANGTNPYLESLHNQMIKTADTKGMEDTPLSYDPSTSTETLLPTIRLALTRIVSDAYAYRFTKDKSYLKHVEMDINTVCDNMAAWNSNYDLERGEISLAFAIAYDWLYNQLKPAMKQRMLDFFQTEIFDKLKDGRFYQMTNNWNLVLNCGMSLAALSTYEQWPDKAKAIIEKSVESNPTGLKTIYAPDGASPEGPGYWGYATNFESIMLMAFEDCLGTDFGLSATEGFDKANKYRAFCVDGLGYYYNYADCSSRARVASASWYLALKFNDTSMLSWEVDMLPKEKYVGDRTLFLAIASAYRLGKFSCTASDEHVLHARGEVPVAILRRGWGMNDAYLGIKGGKCRSSHAHMDLGSFVYDLDGVRWVAEYPHEAYENYRRIIKKYDEKANLFSFSQKSWRWQLFAYSPLQHSTLTIDGQLFDVDSNAEVLYAKEEDGRLSAAVNLSDIYFGKITNATRTATITETDELEIVDEFTVGPEDIDCRWSFVSMAAPKASESGIILTKKDKAMIMKVNGAEVTYRVFPNDPAQCGSVTGKDEKKQKGYYVAGYTFSAKAGETVKLVTTLKRK